MAAEVGPRIFTAGHWCSDADAEVWFVGAGGVDFVDCVEEILIAGPCEAADGFVTAMNAVGSSIGAPVSRAAASSRFG